MCLIVPLCAGCASTDLPHSNDGIGDEDQKDDEGLHEGGDGLLAFLEPGQHLKFGGLEKVKSWEKTTAGTCQRICANCTLRVFCTWLDVFLLISPCKTIAFAFLPFAM